MSSEWQKKKTRLRLVGSRLSFSTQHDKQKPLNLCLKILLKVPPPLSPQTMLPGGDHYLTPALALMNFEIGRKRDKWELSLKKKAK